MHSWNFLEHYFDTYPHSYLFLKYIHQFSINYDLHLKYLEFLFSEITSVPVWASASGDAIGPSERSPRLPGIQAAHSSKGAIDREPEGRRGENRILP